MDENIQSLMKEISILQQLKDSQAKNVNIILEAFVFHSSFWIVSEYCPGGSVSTLMRASRTPGLEEHFIVPIAREMAIALKHVHDAGIIHRDVKCEYTMSLKRPQDYANVRLIRCQSPNHRGWPPSAMRFRRLGCARQ